MVLSVLGCSEVYKSKMGPIFERLGVFGPLYFRPYSLLFVCIYLYQKYKTVTVMARKRIGRYDLITRKVGVLLRIHLPIHLTMPILYFFLRFFLNMPVKATNCFQMHGGSLGILVRFKYILISWILYRKGWV